MPYQTKIGKLYIPCKRGDGEMSEKKQPQQRLFDGMCGGYIDPEDWDIAPHISNFNTGETLWLEVPKTKANKDFAIEASQPETNGVYSHFNHEVTTGYRQNKKFIDFNILSDNGELKNQCSDFITKIYTHKLRMPIIKLNSLPTEAIKDSKNINPLKELIPDVGQITTGVYTVGPTLADYPTYGGVGGFAAAIGADQTGALTGRNDGSITETAEATTTHNQGNFDFTIDSDTNPLGNYNNGHLITYAHAFNQFTFGHEGPGNTYLQKLKSIRTTPGLNPAIPFILIDAISTAITFFISNNLFNGNNVNGAFFRTLDNTPILNLYINLIWQSSLGILNSAINGTSVIENNTLYDTDLTGFDSNSNAETFRNNVSVMSGDDFLNISAATGRNNADSDGTAGDGNWNDGSGNQINIVPADNFESVTPGDGDTFLKPVGGETLATSGISPTFATTLIDNVAWTSEIGAKSKGETPIPPEPTEDSNKNHSSFSFALGAL